MAVVAVTTQTQALEMTPAMDQVVVQAVLVVEVVLVLLCQDVLRLPTQMWFSWVKHL